MRNKLRKMSHLLSKIVNTHTHTRAKHAHASALRVWSLSLQEFPHVLVAQVRSILLHPVTAVRDVPSVVCVFVRESQSV